MTYFAPRPKFRFGWNAPEFDPEFESKAVFGFNMVPPKAGS